MRNRMAPASGLVVLFLLTSVGVATGSAQPVDVDSIREQLKQQWDSIDSIEWVLDEYLEREDGVALPDAAPLHVELSRSKGGLSRMALS